MVCPKLNVGPAFSALDSKINPEDFVVLDLGNGRLSLGRKPPKDGESIADAPK